MHLLNIHDVNDVRLDAYQRPEPGPKDVVVKMKACGICGSDLSYIKNGGIPGPGKLTALGHEGAGEIMLVGEEVAGVSVGQSVIINPMMTPSFIGSGGPEGAFTEELLVRDARLGDSLLPIPDGIPYDVAAMCEPLSVAMHGVNRAQAKAGDKVVVEEFLEEEDVDVGLLAPQHHQHDHLEHLEVDRRFIGGERALDDDLALRRRQLAGLLEEAQEADRLGAQPVHLDLRVDAERALAFGTDGDGLLGDLLEPR